MRRPRPNSMLAGLLITLLVLWGGSAAFGLFTHNFYDKLWFSTGIVPRNECIQVKLETKWLKPPRLVRFVLFEGQDPQQVTVARTLKGFQFDSPDTLIDTIPVDQTNNIIKGVAFNAAVGLFLGTFMRAGLASAFETELSAQIVPTGAPEHDPDNIPEPCLKGGPDFNLTLRVNEADLTGAPRDGGFLNRKVDDDNSASVYYAVLNPPNTSQVHDLQGFRVLNVFTDFDGKFLDHVKHAFYFNVGDLGFGRSMHMSILKNSDGTLLQAAFYVSNFNTVEDAIKSFENEVETGKMDPAPLATVAMEYSPVHPGDAACVTRGTPACPFVTKFYIFRDTNNDGVHEKVPTAALDNRGLKGVPGLCTVCHGGDKFDAAPLIPNPDLHAKFIPFDVEAFGFSKNKPYRKEDQEKVFKEMNLAIADNTNATDTMKELIEGWYDDPDEDQANDRRLTKQNADFIPADWKGKRASETVTSKQLYKHVFKRSCRTCHTQQIETRDFDSFDEFSLLKPLIQARVCRNFGAAGSGTGLANLNAPDMPHARQTYLNFWLSPSRHGEELWHQPAILQEAFGFDPPCTPRPRIVGRRGDVNGDGTIDQADVDLVLKFLEESPTHAVAIYPDPMDLNHNGMITKTDAKKVAKRCDTPCEVP